MGSRPVSRISAATLLLMLFSIGIFAAAPSGVYSQTTTNFYVVFQNGISGCSGLAACPSGWWVDVGGTNKSAPLDSEITIPDSTQAGSATVDYSYGCNDGCAFPSESGNATINNVSLGGNGKYYTVDTNWSFLVVRFAFLSSNGVAIYPSDAKISVTLNGLTYTQTGCPASSTGGYTQCETEFAGPSFSNNAEFPYTVAQIPGYEINTSNAGCTDSSGNIQFSGISWGQSGVYTYNEGNRLGVCFQSTSPTTVTSTYSTSTTSTSSPTAPGTNTSTHTSSRSVILVPCSSSSSTSTTSSSASTGSSTSSTTSTCYTTSSVTSSSSTSTNQSGGIPEFPYQTLALTAFTILIATSYLLVRKKSLLIE